MRLLERLSLRHRVLSVVGLLLLLGFTVALLLSEWGWAFGCAMVLMLGLTWEVSVAGFRRGVADNERTADPDHPKDPNKSWFV